MSVLARAHPNHAYIYYTNLRDVFLEARMVGGKVMYYEVSAGVPIREHPLSEATVESLFPTDRSIRDRPFLAVENKEFFAVLHRRRMKYQKEFLRLKTKASDGGTRNTKMGRAVHRLYRKPHGENQI